MSENLRDKEPVRVRFAPSPTGMTHLGSARTALYNYLLARQTGGQFVLRIEDTDQKRFDPEAEQDLIQGLKWLGLEWDEGPDVGGEYGPYRQSERKAIHREYAEKLIEMDLAFYCFCSKEELDQQRGDKLGGKYAGTCRKLDADEAKARVEGGEAHVIRFKVPKEGATVVRDRLRGEIKFENQVLDDIILVKSDGHAVYHLAAMIDDHLMGITHVFRGEEWLPNLPIHVRIFEAFGWEEPEWVHLSVFLSPTGKGKMSKRETEQMKLTGQTIFVKDLQELGYLPEAVNNWVALMGWSYDDKTEFFTMDDLIEKFSIDKLSSSNPAINFQKFDHFNGLHIRSLAVEELAERLVPYYAAAGYEVTVEQLLPIVPLIRERLVTLDDAPAWTRFLFEETVEPEPESLVQKKMTAEESLAVAKRILEILEGLPDVKREATEGPMRGLAEEMEIKAGQVFGVLRAAVTGQKVSPPLMESMEILGREVVLARVAQGVEILEGLVG